MVMPLNVNQGLQQKKRQELLPAPHNTRESSFSLQRYRTQHSAQVFIRIIPTTVRTGVIRGFHTGIRRTVRFLLRREPDTPVRAGLVRPAASGLAVGGAGLGSRTVGRMARGCAKARAGIFSALLPRQRGVTRHRGVCPD